jgi:Flp pilus assembly protein TadB
MRYDLILLLICLAIPLMTGLSLVLDAVRRTLRERRETNHDLHA